MLGFVKVTLYRQKWGWWWGGRAEADAYPDREYVCFQVAISYLMEELGYYGPLNTIV